MIKKCVCIFSGYNQRAVIAFLRTLRKDHVQFTIIAKSDEDEILLTEYKNNVSLIRDRSELDVEYITSILNQVKNICNSENLIIAPSTEALNRFFVNNRNAFESMGIIIPIVEENLYELVSDKYSFYGLCRNNGIAVPEEVFLEKEHQFPFVAKPKKYYGEKSKMTFKPFFIKTQDDLSYFLNNYYCEEFFFQKYIDGTSFYLLFYIDRNGKVLKCSQENLIQQPDGKSIIAAVMSDFHLEKESSKYEELLRNIDFHGLIMIEVRKHYDTNYMIEANPRFWGPSQLFVDAGINLFEAFLHDYEVIETLDTFEKIDMDTIYFWYGGYWESITSGKRPTFFGLAESDFQNNLNSWMVKDIYKRADTEEIYKRELNNENRYG